MGSKGRARPEDVDETTLEAEDLATHQEAIPVPYLSGTHMVALRWISEATGMVTRQAPDNISKK